MKNVKRFLTCLLVFAMIMSLSACGSTDSNQGSGADTSLSHTESITESTADNADESVPESDEDPPEEKPQLLAAMCKVDITPTDSFSTAGYSGSDIPMANFVTPENFTSDLKARVLILEYDGVRTTHVNFEMLTSPGIPFLSEAAGTDRKYLTTSNTHNHQAMENLNKTQQAALEEAVKNAAERLVPVNIGVDTYGTQYGMSRSPSYSLDLDSPYDNTVTVIRFDNAQTGEPLGLIYNVPIHNTALGRYTPENWKYLNCEFTGYASRYLEEKYADYEDFTAMHINGFYGNSGPYFADREEGLSRYATETVEELKEYGNRFGAEIDTCYEKIDSEPAVDFPIHVYKENIEVPRAEDIQKRNFFGGGDATLTTCQTMSFGNIAYFGVNGEVFSTIGAHLRAEAPFEYLLPAGCVNGWFGYLPLYETFHNGKKEVETEYYKSPFDDKAEAIFYDHAIDVLCNLKGVTYERTLSSITSAEEKEGKRIYTFEFGEEISPDKLVLSFGQESRLDCAECFVLEVYDQAGNKTFSVEEDNNSVNWLGYLTENVKAAKAVLTVTSTYRSESPKDINVTLHAMNYTADTKEE